MTTATIEATNTSKYGFPGYLLNGKWVNGDKKGNPAFQKGDTIEYETYLAKGKYETIKIDSIRKASAPVATASNGAAPSPAGVRNTATSAVAPVRSAYQQKEDYWADKELRDIEKDPRISLQGAYKIAVSFADLALKNGAFAAFAKAKDAAKLDILTSFVDEQAQRIHKESYAATVPGKAPSGAGKALPEVSTGSPVDTKEREPGSDDELDNAEVWS